MQNRNTPIDLGSLRKETDTVRQVFDLLLTVMGAKTAACLFGYRDNSYIGQLHQGAFRFETRFLTQCSDARAYPPRRVCSVETGAKPVSGGLIEIQGRKIRLTGKVSKSSDVLLFAIDDDTVDALVIERHSDGRVPDLDDNHEWLVSLWEKLRRIYLGEAAPRSYDNSLGMIQAVLDAIPAPTVLVRGDRSVVASNAPAASELSAATFVSQANQFLTMAMRADTHLLQNAITAVLDGEDDTRMFLASDAKSGRRVVLEVRQLSIPSTTSINTEPLCMVTLLRRVELTSVARVAAAYGLTQSEQRLVARLTTGSNIRDAAEAVGIKESSARTYIKRVFLKMGVSRQAELISLLSSQGALLRTEAHDDELDTEDET